MYHLNKRTDIFYKKLYLYEVHAYVIIDSWTSEENHIAAFYHVIYESAVQISNLTFLI